MGKAGGGGLGLEAGGGGLGLESPRGAFIIPPLLHNHTHTRTLTHAQQVLVSPK